MDLSRAYIRRWIQWVISSLKYSVSPIRCAKQFYLKQLWYIIRDIPRNNSHKNSVKWSDVFIQNCFSGYLVWGFHYEVTRRWFNTSRPEQNGRHFADDIFKYNLSVENCWIFIKTSLKFVRKGLINQHCLGTKEATSSGSWCIGIKG